MKEINMAQGEQLFENIHNYTKFKIVEMLIENYRDKKLGNLNSMEELADDIIKTLSICGMKYHQELRQEFDNEEN